MVEPTNKKRKIDQPLAKQDSFSAVLQQLEAEEDASGGGFPSLWTVSLTLDSIETSTAWPRPPVRAFDPKHDSIAFQQIEIEEHPDPRLGPTLRLFGVNEHGNSVLAHVYGFRPYFYVAAPSGFLNKDLESLKDTINVSSVQGRVDGLRVL